MFPDVSIPSITNISPQTAVRRFGFLSHATAAHAVIAVTRLLTVGDTESARSSECKVNNLTLANSLLSTTPIWLRDSLSSRLLNRMHLRIPTRAPLVVPIGPQLLHNPARIDLLTGSRPSIPERFLSVIMTTMDLVSPAIQA